MERMSQSQMMMSLQIVYDKFKGWKWELVIHVHHHVAAFVGHEIPINIDFNGRYLLSHLTEEVCIEQYAQYYYYVNDSLKIGSYIDYHILNNPLILEEALVNIFCSSIAV
ncbi:MAG: hypothetical protein ABSF90_26955 [Syntrophobacteraceae bacterium]|jgi:hypothetical protein